MPVHVVLYEPEIPPNTGNIIRLCANTGAKLHLIRPLGFSLDDRALKRAGLDYHEWADMRVHDSLPAFQQSVQPARLWAFSTSATRSYHTVVYGAADALLFGPETRGLPRSLLQSLPEGTRLRLPMQPGNRSINLSNAVAVAVFEAWRQQGFPGAVPTDPA
ncbi:MAG TPA: tRNA (uridine(34)/cytosine(34)/5-carboxymethylaminomethyluridine(34)-2'-O)-methyltransferase TrmL [Acidiferrobacteraceae bacterium]|nr:tRNA (uridine(34)/cytosine(34)/5-carboxymethylaminomethyluridine(34)-2'-O)-methyltransferase TrmL [Acidiferrobacteraceae bacterium]